MKNQEFEQFLQDQLERIKKALSKPGHATGSKKPDLTQQEANSNARPPK